MPELSLPETVFRIHEKKLALTENIELMISIQPFMCYPQITDEHEDMRKKLRVFFSAFFLTSLKTKKQRAKTKGRKLNKRIVAVDKREAELFLELGDLRGLAEAPGISFFDGYEDDILKDWFSVFYIAWTLARLAKIYPEDGRKVSVNKVIHVASKQKNRPPLLHEKKHQLWEAWSKFKPVAHLCAADMLTMTALNEPIPERPVMKIIENFDVYFGFAAYFQNFLTNLKPSNSKQLSLISLDDMWFISDRFEIEHREPPLDPLNPAESEAYDSYKPPIPF